MGIWIDRMHLAQLGWKTEMRVARHGLADKTDLNVGFWAHTWRWHNRVAEVKIHAHASCEANADKLMEVFDDLSAKVVEACERAWREYPDSVPTGCPTPFRMAGLPWFWPPMRPSISICLRSASSKPSVLLCRRGRAGFMPGRRPH